MFCGCGISLGLHVLTKKGVAAVSPLVKLQDVGVRLKKCSAASFLHIEVAQVIRELCIMRSYREVGHTHGDRCPATPFRNWRVLHSTIVRFIRSLADSFISFRSSILSIMRNFSRIRRSLLLQRLMRCVYSYCCLAKLRGQPGGLRGFEAAFSHVNIYGAATRQPTYQTCAESEKTWNRQPTSKSDFDNQRWQQKIYRKQALLKFQILRCTLFVKQPRIENAINTLQSNAAHP